MQKSDFGVSKLAHYRKSQQTPVVCSRAGSFPPERSSLEWPRTPRSGWHKGQRCSYLSLLAVLAEPVSFYPAQSPGERIFCSFSFLLSLFSVPTGVWLQLWLFAEVTGEAGGSES